MTGMRVGEGLIRVVGESLILPFPFSFSASSFFFFGFFRFFFFFSWLGSVGAVRWVRLPVGSLYI